MKTILTKLKYKPILFEKIQGYAGRHYILPYIISKDETLRNQLKVFNGILTDNILSSNFIDGLYTFISDRLLFRIINEEKDIFDESLYLPEEGENKYQKFKKRILYIYKSGKYKEEISNIEINDLQKYFPKDKEFALFIFDFMNHTQQLKKDITKFYSYYDNNIHKFDNKENKNKNQISNNETKSEIIYKQMNRKPVINVAFIGNKNSGKSTTIGHLLYNTGNIDEKFFIETKNYANKLRKGKYIYSWLINKLRHEKESNKTIIYHINKFESNKYDFNLIDLPGDFRYIKNAIKGISLADAVAIVIPAENENSENDHIKDYLVIAYTMGIRQIIIAINKMDQTKDEIYSEKNYIKIKKNMINLCKNIGYNFNDIQVIAYSGYTGQNLVNKYEDENKLNKMNWYKGKTLLESLDELKVPKRSYDGPLIISVVTYKWITRVGYVLRGKILSGQLKLNTTLETWNNFDNGIKVGRCESIEIHHQKVEEAIAGDIIGFLAKGFTKLDALSCKLCCKENEMNNIRKANNLRVKILIINKKVTLRIGSSFSFFCYTLNKPVKIVKIEYDMDETNKIFEKDPEEIKYGECAIMIIKFENTLFRQFYNNVKSLETNIHCQKYIDNPFLGSFALVNSGLIAVGNILDMNIL